MEQIKITCVSNIVLEPYFPTCLENAFFHKGLMPLLTRIDYEDFMTQKENSCNPDYIVVFLNFENMYPDVVCDMFSHKLTPKDFEEDAMKKCSLLYNNIKHAYSCPILWIGFEDYSSDFDSIGNVAQTIQKLVDVVNIYIFNNLQQGDRYIDLKRLIARHGIANSFCLKNKYRWNSPYSKSTLSLIAYEILKSHLMNIGCTKKCIVLDCDNVLWGGIISEDGVDGIQLGNSGLGKEYQDFQRFLLTLYYHGVILTVCSKNDVSEVLKVFHTHSGMKLQEEHISYFSCNWNNKADNIKAISKALNIGIDSMVFVDDSDYEIDAVRAELSDITAIKYDRNNIYENLSCFILRPVQNIDDLKKRAKTYRTNAKRAELFLEAASISDYLAQLNSKVDIHKTTLPELARISELSQRTNKCTNGYRYTVSQIKECFNLGVSQFYTISVSDKFSDLGIVGALCVKNGILEMFSLSCRAMHRNVEGQMLDFVKAMNVTRALFKSTGKNTALYNLLNSNFEVLC